MKSRLKFFKQIKTDEDVRVFCKLEKLTEIEKETGIHHTTLSSWRSGKLKLNEKQIKQIREFLNKKYGTIN